jgi:RimJ/RimL family protein N-acetyltransferase
VPFWGKGYAREAAEASLAWGWEHLDVPTIAAITTTNNVRSSGLMERLGMVRAAADDFDHPNVPLGSGLRRHITYRIARPARR